jgi:hypothetical protein
MPPRKSAKPDSKAAAAAAAAADLATEQDPLQAVILADSFNRRFDVLCVDKPRVSSPFPEVSQEVLMYDQSACCRCSVFPCSRGR